MGRVAALGFGSTLIIKGEAGLSLNTANFFKALDGDKTYLPSSGIELIAKKTFGNSPNVQKLALATDMTIDLLTNPALGSVRFANKIPGGLKFVTNSSGVPLSSAVPALFQAPRITNLATQIVYKSPEIYKYAEITGRYSGFGSSLFADYELGKIDYKLWK